MMKSTLALNDYPRVRGVGSFEELMATPFADGVNALCWERSLAGDFSEVVSKLNAVRGITTLDEDDLLRLELTEAGKAAVKAILGDQQLLREHGLDPVLDCVNGYLAVEDDSPVRTDVCSFHADGATAAADTFLCTYFGASSEGLSNEDAVRRVDIPETRAALLRHYGGEDDEGFLDYLSENCFDLHYAAKVGAKPWHFGVGNLWRIAVQYPGCPVPPCIHRAPDPIQGMPPRLLLLS
jgi:hypothetical protein